MDDRPLESLEAEVARTCPDIAAGLPPQPKEERDPNAPAPRPKSTSMTGIVWLIADEQFVLAGNQMPDRKAVIDACVAEEINASTASTQYSKWKTSKLASIGS